MKKGNVVGENIRKLRLGLGLTQEGLALKSGLSQGYINQLENGGRNYTQKTLEVIATSLSVPIVVFFDENSMSPCQSQNAAGKGKRQEYKKELNNLLKGLPDQVVEHYLTLIKLEKELLQREKD